MSIVLHNRHLKKILFVDLFFHYFTRSSRFWRGSFISFQRKQKMRNYFTIVFLIALSCAPGITSAQQDPQFSQYIFTKLPYNPAFAGSNDAICGTLLYRNQWTGFGGEPKSMLFTADMPLDLLHGGVGISVYAADNLGVESNLNARLAYAYRADLGAGRIAAGVDVGYHQKSLDGSKFIFNDTGDNSIPTNNQSGGTLDMSFGAYYNTDNMYVGISSTHLQEGSIKFSNVDMTLARHYFLMAGYSQDLTSSLTLKPSVLVKSDAVSTTFDVNANLVINSRFWVGAGYRLQDAIVLTAGLEIIPNLKFGYSYDLTTSEIKTFSSGTHEVMLGYCFKPTQNVKRQFHRNVRFL